MERSIPLSDYRRGVVAITILALVFVLAAGLGVATEGRAALLGAAGIVGIVVLLGLVLLRAARPAVQREDTPTSWPRATFEVGRDVLAFFGALQILMMLLR